MGDLKEKCMPCFWRLARRLLQETWCFKFGSGETSVNDGECL